jgi:hypothetical protein
LSRRTVLTGVGCAVGLPLLEAMLPRSAFAAEAAKPPVRMGFVSFPNGAIMDAWKPKVRKRQFPARRNAETARGCFERVTVISGLPMITGGPRGCAGDHAAPRRHCSRVRIRSGLPGRISTWGKASIKPRPSVGHLTRLPSLEIGLERGRDAGRQRL